jgi:hypothetical protein
MSRRARILSFGGAILLIVLSGPIDAAIGGVTGEAVAISLGSLGLIALVSLAFLEVGLSEDRERAREDAQRRHSPPQPPRPARPLRPSRLPRRPRRPS